MRFGGGIFGGCQWQLEQRQTEGRISMANVGRVGLGGDVGTAEMGVFR